MTELLSLYWMFGLPPLLQEILRRGQQVVTEQEREHVMSGNLGQLVDEQKRIDMEREAEVGIEGSLA